jgi:hypothetical protein
VPSVPLLKRLWTLTVISPLETPRPRDIAVKKYGDWKEVIFTDGGLKLHSNKRAT